MANNLVHIQVSGQHRQFLADVQTVLRNSERRAAINKVRQVNDTEMRPLSRELRRMMPPSSRKTARYKRTGRQPYTHLKKAVRLQTFRKNRTGRVIAIHKDAFHYRFLEYGTKQRKTKSGANRGKIRGKWGSNAGFNAVDSVRQWSEQSMKSSLQRIPEKLYRAIYLPASRKMRNRYTTRILYQINRP